MSSLQQFLVNRRQFLNYGGSMAGLMAVSDLSGPRLSLMHSAASSFRGQSMSSG